MTAQKFAICNETFAPLDAPNPWSWKRTCQFLSETGYKGVELAPFTFAHDVREISVSQRNEIQRIAADNGLEIVGLHWLLVSPPGLHLHTTDTTRRQKALDYLKALVEFAGDVGAPVLVLGSPKARTIENGDAVGAWLRMCETLTALTEILTACNAMLCPEALPRPEADFLLTQSEAWRMVKEINHPTIQMMLDVKSMCSEGLDAPATLCQEFGAHTVHVHANDANRRGPGFGDIDFKPIATALKESNFSGYVSVEVFDYSPDPETIARESLRYLKASWE